MQPIEDIYFVGGDDVEGQIDYEGVLIYRYRGALIRRDALEHGGTYYVDLHENMDDGPEYPFSTLDKACLYVDSVESMHEILAKYFGTLDGSTY